VRPPTQSRPRAPGSNGPSDRWWGTVVLQRRTERSFDQPFLQTNQPANPCSRRAEAVVRRSRQGDPEHDQRSGDGPGSCGTGGQGERSPLSQQAWAALGGSSSPRAAPGSILRRAHAAAAASHEAMPPSGAGSAAQWRCRTWQDQSQPLEQPRAGPSGGARMTSQARSRVWIPRPVSGPGGQRRHRRISTQLS